jgi:hypothetical protein
LEKNVSKYKISVEIAYFGEYFLPVDVGGRIMLK